MMRRTPMKRTGFKRKVYERAPRQSLANLPPMPHVTYGGSTSGEPILKHEYIRSPALLEAVRALGRCTAGCGYHGRLEASHSNWAQLGGKCKSRKSSDEYIAGLCASCHRAIDQGSKMTEYERQIMWWSAHSVTVRILLAKAAWPRDVPVPDVSFCPFERPVV